MVYKRSHQTRRGKTDRLVAFIYSNVMLLYDIDIARRRYLSNDSKIEVNRGNRIVDNPNQKLKTGIY